MPKYLRHKNGAILDFNESVLAADPSNLEVIEASFPPHADDQLTEDERLARDKALAEDEAEREAAKLKPAPSAKKKAE